jgi:hypothetical protein
MLDELICFQIQCISLLLHLTIIMEVRWHGGRTLQFRNRLFEGWVHPEGEVIDEAAHTSLIANHFPLEYAKGTDINARVFDWPGEYEVSNVPFVGVESQENEVSYTFHFEEGNVTVLGKLKDVPTDDFLDKLGETHCLVISLADGGLSSKKMFNLVEKMEPMVLIPLYEEEKNLEAFLKEADVKDSSHESRYTLKRLSGLENQSMEVVVLKRS